MDQTVAELKAEVERLKQIVRELTEAVKVLTEKEERARAFVARVEELLNGN